MNDIHCFINTVNTVEKTTCFIKDEIGTEGNKKEIGKRKKNRKGKGQ